MGAEPVPSRGLALAFTGTKDMAKQRTVVYVDVGVINPQKQKCRTLEESATFYKHIRETALAASQFPAVLQDAAGTFHKPAKW